MTREIEACFKHVVVVLRATVNEVFGLGREESHMT